MLSLLLLQSLPHLFSRFATQMGDIKGFKSKIHYLPKNNTFNKTGKSTFILETSDCYLDKTGQQVRARHDPTRC